MAEGAPATGLTGRHRLAAEETVDQPLWICKIGASAPPHNSLRFCTPLELVLRMQERITEPRDLRMREKKVLSEEMRLCHAEIRASGRLIMRIFGNSGLLRTSYNFFRNISQKEGAIFWGAYRVLRERKTCFRFRAVEKITQQRTSHRGDD